MAMIATSLPSLKCLSLTCGARSMSTGTLFTRPLEDTCAICFDPLFEEAMETTESGERRGTGRLVRDVISLSCGHAFHADCMRRVLETHSGPGRIKCPKCRELVTRSVADELGVTMPDSSDNRVENVQRDLQGLNLDSIQLTQAATDAIRRAETEVAALQQALTAATAAAERWRASFMRPGLAALGQHLRTQLMERSEVQFRVRIADGAVQRVAQERLAAWARVQSVSDAEAPFMVRVRREGIRELTRLNTTARRLADSVREQLRRVGLSTDTQV